MPLEFLQNHLREINNSMMKKILLSTVLMTSIISCGSPDGTTEDTDGLTPENHRVFVTSTSHQGNFGNLTTADLKCKEAAEGAGLTRTYRAILSTAAQTAISRLNFTGSIYIFTSTTEKLLVAASEADLWGSGSKVFLNKINIDEKYASTSGVSVWTGTTSDGGVANDNCTDWTVTTGLGWYGNPDKLDTEWTESNTANCNNSYRIYCISQ